MAKKRSAKEIDRLLEFSNDTGTSLETLGLSQFQSDGVSLDLTPNENFNNLMQTFRHQTALDIIDRFLPNPDQKKDVSEEVMTDPDGKIRRYRVTKDSNGKIIDKSLIDPVEGVTLDDAIKNANPYTGQVFKTQLFKMMRESIDPDTKEFKNAMGKDFWTSAFENSIPYELGRLGAAILDNNSRIGRYGLNETFLNNLKFNSDGVYYKDNLISNDPKEIGLIKEFIGKKTTYVPKKTFADKLLGTDHFFDTFAHGSATFLMDLPAYMVAGGFTEAALGRAIPGIMGANFLPGKVVTSLLQTTGTLGLATAPSIINHSFTEGRQAFLDDMKNLAEFSVMAGGFGVAGDYLGNGVSKLLRRPRLLTMSEGTAFLRRNPKVVQTLVGGATSGALGYFSSSGNQEDKIATGLMFASLHFSTPSAWKSYVDGDKKNIMVEKDGFDLLRVAAKNGRNLVDAIKELGTTVPRYLEREGDKLYLIDQDKFINNGTVERVGKEPVTTLSESNAKDFNYISEVVPFVKKTFKQSFKDAKFNETVRNTWKKKFKNIKNPYDKKAEPDLYQSFEYNKRLSSTILASMIFDADLTKALRRNELPADLKIDKFVSEAAGFFELPDGVFRNNLKDDFIRYVQDPKGFFDKGGFKFTPEQYKKTYVKGFETILDAYERKAINEEINKIFQRKEEEKNAQLQKFTEIQNEKQNAIIQEDAKSKEIQNRQGVKKTSGEGLTPEQQARLEQASTLGKLEQSPITGRLVDEKGRPLQGTKGAGLTKEEESAFGRQREPVKASVKETVDKIKTLPDLNEALEKADSPLEIIQELKNRFKGEPTSNVKSSTNIEEQKKIAEEKKKSKTQRRNERARKVRKLKKAEFNSIPLNERAKLLLTNKEYEKFKENPKSREIRNLIEDRFLEQRTKIREATKPKEVKTQSDEELRKAFKDSGVEGDYKGIIKGRGGVPQAVVFDIKVDNKGKLQKSSMTMLFRDGKITPEKIRAKAEAKIKEFNPPKEKETVQSITEEIKKKTDEVRKQYTALEDKLRKQGVTEKELDLLRTTKPGELKDLYDKAINLDMEKHKRIQALEVPVGVKAVKLEDGTIIQQPEAKSHIAMKLTAEQRNKIADIGVVGKDGKFTSTMTVGLKEFKEALEIIAKNSKASSGFDPELLFNYAKAGAYYFERGFNNFANWSRQMISKFGEGIKRFLRGIWEGAKAILTGEKALFDPRTLGIMGMQSGKEFNELMRERKEQNLLRNQVEKPNKTITNKQEGTTTTEKINFDTNTPTEIKNELKRLSDEIFAPKNKMTKMERKTFKSIISKLERYKPRKIKGRLVGTTLTADEHAKLHNIRKLVRIDAETQSKLIEKLIEDIDKLEATPDKTPEQRQKLLDAEDLFANLQRFGNLKAKRGEELDYANEGIKEIIAEGRTKRRAKEEARLKRRNAILEKSRDEVGEAVSIAKARALGLDVEKPSLFQKISEADNRMLGLEHLLNKFSKKSNFLSEYFYKKLIKDANEKKARGIRLTTEALENKLKEIYGLEGRALSQELGKNKERHKSGVFINDPSKIKLDAEGKEIGKRERIELDISQNEAYKKWMEWQAPGIRPTMEEMGFTEESIKQLENYMRPEVKKWAQFQLDTFYPDYSVGVNEVYRERFGADLVNTKNYSPISRKGDREINDNPLLRRGSQYATVVNQHLKMRVKSRAELRYVDGDEMLMKHIAEMEHFKAFVEPVRELRSVFGDKTLRVAIEQQYGNKALKVLDELVDDIARGGTDASKSIVGLEKFRRNVTKSMIASPVIFIKQLTSFPAFAADIPLSDFFNGIADFLSHPQEATKILMESEVMRARYSEGAMDRDVHDVMAKRINHQLTGARSVTDALTFMTRMGDRAAILFGGWGVYKYHLEKGLAEGLSETQAKKRAMREFEVSTERMQQSAKIEDLSSLQRSGSIGKLFTMFMTAPNSYYRVASGAFRDLARGKGVKSDNIKKLVIAHFVLPMLFQLAADGFNFNAKRQLRAGVLGSLNGLLIIGDWLEAGFAGLQGDFHFEIQGTPVLTPVKDFISALDKMGKIIDTGAIDTKDVLQVVDKMASGTSKIVGIPYDTGRRVGEAVIEGKDAREIIGYSDVSLQQTKSDLTTAKRRTNFWHKRYKAHPTPENYAAYIEYRRDYRRLLKQLKQKERTK